MTTPTPQRLSLLAAVLAATLIGLLIGLVAATVPARAADAVTAGTDTAVAPPVTLRQTVLVEGGTIRLGDLFDGVGERADKVVAYAPAPGGRVTLDARFLTRVARAFRLNWRPTGNLVQAVVRRDSLAINRDDIAEAVLNALAAQGLDTDVDLEFGNRSLRLHVPVDAAPTLRVEDVVHDARTNRFTALVAAPADDPTTRVRITGRLYPVAEVPVLTRRLAQGERVSAGDVEVRRVRDRRLQRDAILDPDNIIGMAAKRTLRAGQPLRQRDVREPVLVPKRSLVTMHLNLRHMTLTAKGKALDEGGRGDVIRVANLRTKTIVEATVTDAGTVRVDMADRLAAVN